jgi:FMN-dependent NADH-azoreductase
VIDRLQDSEDLYDYITFSQFLDMLQRMFPKQVWLPEEIKTQVLIDDLYQQIMMDIFDSMPRKSKGLVSTCAFISSLKDDPQVQQFSKIEVRKGQNIEQVFSIITREAADLITWDDFIQYFSEKQRPDVKIQADGVNRGNFYALKEDFVKKIDEKEQKEEKDKKRGFSYQYVDTFKNKKKPKAQSTVKFTVPVPFHFDSRERNKSKSIRQIKLEQYVNEIKQEEENHLKYRPSANPVPAEVLIPKYNTLIAAQESRRNEVKQNSKKLTQQREQPFEFYKREMNKVKPEEIKEIPYKFKARPPPPSNSIPLFEQMSRKLEDDRKVRIETAAKKALEEAKLPPRMERYEKGDKNLSTPPVVSMNFKAKKPPNFHNMWDEFGKSLEKKKQSFQPTVPKEFNLTEKQKNSKEEVLDEDLAKKGFQEITKKKLAEIKEMDPTKKQAENDETGKKRREELKKKEEEKKKMKEEREILEELTRKRLEEKQKKEREKVMLGVKDRPPIEDAITSEYSKMNSGTRVLTTIKQKMQARGIPASNIIGESDNFIEIIAEDLV